MPRPQTRPPEPAPAIVWLRLDLRLDDHPALYAAARRGGPVIPVFIEAPEEEAPWAPGGASRWWLSQSLRALGGALRAIGSRLIPRRGPSIETLLALARETGARAVFWSRRYEPALRERDLRAEAALREAGLEVETFNSALLFEPRELRTRAGGPFQVFTPFYKAALAAPPPGEPLPAPARLAAPAAWPESLALEALGLEPRVDWAGGLRARWTPGEAGARERLARFLATSDPPCALYSTQRDRLDLEGGSALSPHLHFGEISPRRIWSETRRWIAAAPGAAAAESAGAFLRQIVWREFAHHMLWHFPHTAEAPLRPHFAAFPWSEDREALAAWRRGRTGYAFVDAAMRELWATGWTHNRARMVAASFLVKHLRIHWLEGARWFWDTLVDADLANNTFGWQWTAGSGADAAPYFRIFNPVAQAAKFDPRGEYIRRWIPELRGLAPPEIFAPWEAPPARLREAGLRPGETYPRPIVDHAAARDRALAAYARIRRASPSVEEE